MKRAYQQPQTQCIGISLQHIIAISADGTTDQTQGNLARRERPERHDRYWEEEDDWEDEENY